jgi:adenine-specific DNA-methyltransferase
MKPLTANDPETKSPDLTAENIAKLKALFPELVTEDGVNVDVLKQLVGQTVTDTEEKYGLNWHGKRQARQLALTPSTGTLRPCPADSVDWDTTRNLMIEGDNLEVLKLLQKSYAGKVKLIYIDPPYNKDADVIYPDDFVDNIRNYQMLTGQAGSDGRKLGSATESSGRHHTNWLNLIYPRLRLARDVLRDDGVLFISIDEQEYSHLRTICCEIFGEENQMGTIVWKNATDNNPTNIATEHEYILVVAKGRDALENEWKSSVSDVKEVLVRIGKELAGHFSGDALAGAYDLWFKAHKAELWPLDRYKYIDSGGVYTGSQSVHNPGKEGYRYDVIHPVTKKPCKQPLMGYRFPKDTMDGLISEGRILFGEDEEKIIELKVYAFEYEEKLGSVLELDGRLGSYDLKDDFEGEEKVFNNPKPVRLLTTFFSFILKQDGDLALDFFAGSGTAAKAIFRLNVKDQIRRRFCLVQLQEPLKLEDKEQRAAARFCDKLGKPRVITELTKERLRRAGKKIREEYPMFAGDLGFRVFKLATSNIQAWEPDRERLAETLEASVDHLKTDRTEQDILFELLLKLGLDLTVPIETRIMGQGEGEKGGQGDKAKGGNSPLPPAPGGHLVHSIGAGTLMVCLSKSIAAAEVEPLALGMAAWHKALAPAGESTVVFRDSAFADDVAKTNLTAILEQHGLTNVRSL